MRLTLKSTDRPVKVEESLPELGRKDLGRLVSFQGVVPDIYQSLQAMWATGFWMLVQSEMCSASPSVEQMAEAMKVAHAGAGVLRLYGNYGGDVMNFDMAGEQLEMEEDIQSTTVLADDVSSAPLEEAGKLQGSCRNGLRFQNRRSCS